MIRGVQIQTDLKKVMITSIPGHWLKMPKKKIITIKGNIVDFFKWFGQNQRNRKSKPNQTEKISDLVWFGLKPIRTNQNRSSLVWFMVFHFEIRETDEPIR